MSIKENNIISLRKKKRERGNDLLQSVEDKLRAMVPANYVEPKLESVKSIPILTFETAEELARYEKENNIENTLCIVKEEKQGKVIPWTMEK